ncbi:MAG: permease, partial [Anaerolineales bacterium]|nr:permease [Anaerolineales bacterium]
GSVLRPDKNWRFKMFVNGFGAVCTAIVMGVFAVTKFTEGAWIVLIVIPLLVSMFFTIHRHYKDLAAHLTLDKFKGLPARQTRHRVIMPVSGVHQGTLDALRYARLLSDDVTAVHVSIDDVESEKVQRKWKTWGDGTRLVVLDSPFRLFIEPLLEYIEEIIENRQPNETITIVVPQFMPSKRWHTALHMRTANVLRQELLSKHGVVVTDVPYHVHKVDKE